MATSCLTNLLKIIRSLLLNGSLSIQTKFICTALTISYCLSFHERTLVSLAVLPGDILHPNFWIWTFFTHNLLEIRWWLVMFDLIIMILYGRLLHPVWGAREMLIFYIVVNLSVAILTVVTYFVLYVIMKNPDFIFDIYIYGLAGYVAGFFIVLKQIMPEQIMLGNATSYWKCHCRNAPMLSFSVVIFLGLLNCISPTYMIMFFWGLAISWIYLRYYQRHLNGNCGDNSDNFSFASFFPKHLQPVAKICSTITWAVLVMLPICARQRTSDSDSSTTITVRLHGSEAQDQPRLLPENLQISGWSAADNCSELSQSHPGEVEEKSDLDAAFVIINSDMNDNEGVSTQSHDSHWDKNGM